MFISKRLLIGACLCIFALCGGVIAASLNPGMVANAAEHLDISDILLTTVLLAVSAASATYSG